MPRNKKRKQQPGKESHTIDASDEGNHSEADQSAYSAQRDDGDSRVDALIQEPNQPTSDSAADANVIEAVQFNTELLQHVLDQLSDLRQTDLQGDAPGTLARALIDHPGTAECDHHHERIAELEAQVAELQQQNGDLASRVASSNVQQSVSTPQSSSNDALSWEERKQVILQQMESDTFDSEEFISSLQRESTVTDSPSEFVESLYAELGSRDQELARREEEIHELRCLLDHQSETRDGGVAIGAAAIAEMVDDNELVEQERKRLQLLQAEWEEKFRQSEIEASLERAKLSRERQQLAKKQAELEEQLEHIRRAERHGGSEPGTSRKWLVALGLADES